MEATLTDGAPACVAVDCEFVLARLGADELGTGDETGVHAARGAVALEIVDSSVCPLPFLFVMVLVGVGPVLRLAGRPLAALAGESS